MRLSIEQSFETATNIKEFVDWILQIGNGDMNLNEVREGIIKIPQDLLIENIEQPSRNLIEFFYPDFL